MLLYRPTGLRELQLVAASGWKAWPPRLPEQPIFYPVLTLEYARKIARDWNANDEVSGFVGFVTEFRVDPQFTLRFRCSWRVAVLTRSSGSQLKSSTSSTATSSAAFVSLRPLQATGSQAGSIQ